MTRYFLTLALLFTCLPAEAVLTVRLDGNGLSDARIHDGDMAGVLNPLTGLVAIGTDTNGAAGFLELDATALPGWTAGGPMAFDIFASNEQTHPAASNGGGQINVVADYDVGAGFGASITVAAADQFVVRNNVSTVFAGFTEIVGDGDVFASNHYFNSSTPITPADPFLFAAYGDSYNLVPTNPLGGPSGPLDSVEGLREFSIDAPVQLGIELQVANQFNVVLGTGDIGTVASTTIVNPEPASVLLSGFGAVLFGFGYYRRRKSQPAEEA